jgi:LysM repeat protein
MKRRFRSITSLLVAVATIAALTLAVSAPVAAASQYPTGPYWYAEYFDARWPTATPVLARLEADIDFDWGTGSPSVDVPVDNFSARWTRTVEFEGGLYKFSIIHDDGVLLWIDDQLIINQWYDQPAYLEYTHGPTVANIHTAEVPLGAGPHRIKLEYYEHGKDAVVELEWGLQLAGPSAFVPSPASTLQTDKIHVVRPGEWLYKIARDYGVSVHAIMNANGLSSGGLVPGQQLVIPTGSSTPAPPEASAPASPEASAPTSPAASPAPTNCSGTYIVQGGDNLFRISLKFSSPLSTMAAQNGISSPYTLHVGQALCVP